MRLTEGKDEQIEELIETVRIILDEHQSMQKAIADSLNALTERIDQIEKDYKKIIGRKVAYNAIKETEGVPDNVKLDLIMKIVNYENEE